MRKLFYIWRFYSFGREQYQECMNRIFVSNLQNLHKAGRILAIFAAISSIFPAIIERNFLESAVYLLVALLSLSVSYIANFLMQQININTKVIYILITAFYSIIMLFGVYLDIWSFPNANAAIFPCFLICALLMSIVSPMFVFYHTIGAVLIFNISAFLFISYDVVVYYVLNSAVAGVICLYFSWQITKLRLGLEISTALLEEERNKYENQSITDELTQLRNRRDFMHTFQRYLSNYRSSDDWLCIALADIDFFKLYNDHYGHPKGDECLRGIGAALNSLSHLGVYAARVGGEEFALLWFEKDASNVDKIINQWTDTIRDLKILHEKSKVADYVTMSIGVYIMRCGSSHDSKTLYDHADKALYTAKGSGRNCAIICGDEIKEYKITAVQ